MITKADPHVVGQLFLEFVIAARHRQCGLWCGFEIDQWGGGAPVGLASSGGRPGAI
jgi:hypothetical protein